MCKEVSGREVLRGDNERNHDGKLEIRWLGRVERVDKKVGR